LTAFSAAHQALAANTDPAVIDLLRAVDEAVNNRREDTTRVPDSRRIFTDKLMSGVPPEDSIPRRKKAMLPLGELGPDRCLQIGALLMKAQNHVHDLVGYFVPLHDDTAISVDLRSKKVGWASPVPRVQLTFFFVTSTKQCSLRQPLRLLPRHQPQTTPRTQARSLLRRQQLPPALRPSSTRHRRRHQHHRLPWIWPSVQPSSAT
jgi:hypothetical protein